MGVGIQCLVEAHLLGSLIHQCHKVSNFEIEIVLQCNSCIIA